MHTKSCEKPFSWESLTLWTSLQPTNLPPGEQEKRGPEFFPAKAEAGTWLRLVCSSKGKAGVRSLSLLNSVPSLA